MFFCGFLYFYLVWYTSDVSTNMNYASLTPNMETKVLFNFTPLTVSLNSFILFPVFSMHEIVFAHYFYQFSLSCRDPYYTKHILTVFVPQHRGDPVLAPVQE